MWIISMDSMHVMLNLHHIIDQIRMREPIWYDDVNPTDMEEENDISTQHPAITNWRKHQSEP